MDLNAQGSFATNEQHYVAKERADALFDNNVTRSSRAVAATGQRRLSHGRRAWGRAGADSAKTCSANEVDYSSRSRSFVAGRN